MKSARAQSNTAQSSLEYLVLTATILIIATVAVSLVVQSGSTKTTVEYTYCQAAAKQCSFSLKLDPSYDCAVCEKQCVNSADAELFTGAINCCKAGNFSSIFEGATGCVGTGPIIPAAAFCNATNASVVCNDSKECTSDTCPSGSCVNTPLTGQTCSGGVCSGGDCVSLSCGNGTVEGAEDCDPPTSECTPSYGGTCIYCNSNCINTTKTGSYCGDIACDAGFEDCISCSNDCGECTVSSVHLLSSESATRGYSFFVLEDYAYVNSGFNAFYIVDISNRSSPHQVGFINLGDQIYDIFVQGNYAYVVTIDDGLKIIDVSIKSNPILRSSFNSGHYRVFVQGDYAYTTDWDGDLHIIDVSNKNTPSEVGSYPIIGNGESIFVKGDYAYLGHSGNFSIIDISDKNNPQEIGFYDAFGVDGSVYDISVQDNYAYLTGSKSEASGDEDSLRILDISNKNSPLEVGFYVGDRTYHNSVQGNYAYLSSTALGIDGLTVLDIRDKAHPLWVTERLGRCNDISVNYPFIYIVSNLDGLVILQINP